MNPLNMSLDDIIRLERETGNPIIDVVPPLVRSGSLSRNVRRAYSRGRTPCKMDSPPPLIHRSQSRYRSRSRSRTPGPFQDNFKKRAANQWNWKGRQSRRDQYEFKCTYRPNYNMDNGNWGPARYRSRSRSHNRYNFNGYRPEYNGNYDRQRSRSRNNYRNRSRSRSQSCNHFGNNRQMRSCSLSGWERSNSRQRMNFPSDATSIEMRIPNPRRNGNVSGPSGREDVDADELRHFAVGTGVPLGERFKSH